MDRINLKTEKRETFGRKVKSLRKEGVIPANVYGKKIKSLAIQVKKDEFTDVYKQVGETGLIDLLIGKSKKPVLISNVQTHPVTDEPIHTDFRQVDLTEKVSASVSIELIGESPAAKSGLGTVVQQLDEVEVKALPTDLPEKFEVDISILEEVDQSISIGDLKYSKSKVEILAEADQVIVRVEPPQKEEEPEPPPATTEETEEEVDGDKATEETEEKEELSEEAKKES